MEVDYTAYLSKLNDVDLGLFWIIASPKAGLVAKVRAAGSPTSRRRAAAFMPDSAIVEMLLIGARQTESPATT